MGSCTMYCCSTDTLWPTATLLPVAVLHFFTTLPIYLLMEIAMEVIRFGAGFFRCGKKLAEYTGNVVIPFVSVLLLLRRMGVSRST